MILQYLEVQKYCSIIYQLNMTVLLTIFLGPDACFIGIIESANLLHVSMLMYNGIKCGTLTWKRNY